MFDPDTQSDSNLPNESPPLSLDAIPPTQPLLPPHQSGARQSHRPTGTLLAPKPQGASCKPIGWECYRRPRGLCMHMNSLPKEVLLKWVDCSFTEATILTANSRIFSYLDVVSLCRCASVCRVSFLQHSLRAFQYTLCIAMERAGNGRL